MDIDPGWRARRHLLAYVAQRRERPLAEREDGGFDSRRGHVSKKRRETPEEVAYALVTELREQNQIARACLAEMKDISKKLEQQKAEVDKMIFAIRKDLDGLIQDHVGKEVEAYADAVRVATEKVGDEMRARITKLASAMLGLPEGILSGDERAHVTISPLLGMPVVATRKGKP